MPRPRSQANQSTHFAFIDEVVEIKAGGSIRSYVILDCITCDAANQLKDTTWATISEGDESFNNTMVLSVELDVFRRAFPELQLGGQWLRFRLGEEEKDVAGREGTMSASFVNLSGTADEVATPRFSLSGIAPVSAPMKKLALLTGINSRKDEITRVLDGPRRRHFPQHVRNVIVYDIGQGSATALVDIHGHPMIYFDLGWPTSLNRGTRPLDPPSLFCSDACLRCCGRRFDTAPVILSHWDFDHWAYAIENDNYNYGKKAANMTFRPEALARPWIVPKPPRIKNTKGLGPTHMRLLAALPQRIFWPNRLQSVSFFAGTMTRTDPKKASSDRNNQGLAWFVKSPGSADTLLLPGDISFDHLTMPKLKINITKLLASHHGGLVGGIVSDLPTAPPDGTLVLSVGAGNIHGHPIPAILAGYAAAGWGKDVRTSTRSVSPLSAPRQNGSVLMQLRAADPKPHYCCPCLHKGNLVPTQ